MLDIASSQIRKRGACPHRPHPETTASRRPNWFIVHKNKMLQTGFNKQSVSSDKDVKNPDKRQSVSTMHTPEWLAISDG
jgi:hypothetical protein